MPHFYCEDKLVVEQECPFPGLIVAAILGINYSLATGYLANKHSYCIENLFLDLFNYLTTFFS